MKDKVIISQKEYRENLSLWYDIGYEVGSMETAEKILNEWAETDRETGGFNLPHIIYFAKQFGVEVKE